VASIRRWWERRAWSCAAGLLCAVTASLLSSTAPIERWELRTQDHRFHLRGPRTTRAKIVIVGIADSTLAAWPEPMAFWEVHYAAAIRKAKELGARWVGLDFIQGVSGGEEADRELALALHEGNVVLSQIHSARGQPVNPIPPLLYAHPEQPVNLGFVDIQPEADSIVRRALLFCQEGGRVAASFPAVLALRLEGRSPQDERALRALATDEGRRAGASSFWINFVGPPGSFPSLPLERLTDGHLSEGERTAVRDAVVLIGPTYSGSNDEHQGLGGVYYPGVELNAHALATLIDHRPLRRAGQIEETLITAAVGIVTAAIVALLPLGRGLLLVLLAGGAWCWGAVRAFQSDQLWPTAGPCLAMTLSWTGHHVARSVEETRRRRHIQHLFGRYVTPDIVEYLLRHPSHLQLGGEEREVSVLFIDIRGHTAASQRRKPSVVLAELNELFCRIVPVIQRHGGLIYGFRGDGFLAVFGAPRPLEDHAQAAVEAAIDAVRGTRRISADRVQAGGKPVRIGCAVHSGLVVCGNLGGVERAEFTVIGDTVNTAARLEELNKSAELNADVPSEVVISQETCQLLRQRPPMRGPFSLAIRGREGQTLVHKVEVSDE
jgi:adenylate cyclase